MARVSVEVGVTLHIGNPSNNEYLKVSAGIHDIDTELDLRDQLEIAHDYLNGTWALVSERIEQRIKEEMDRAIVA